MAKALGQSSDLSGKVGLITYAQTKYGTVAYLRKKVTKIPRRSERQMEIRTQWVNLGAIYRQFNKTLKKAFEGLGNQMSVYNAFVQANINVVKVYISKQEKLNGGSVLAPYMITRGSMPSIVITKNGSDVLVTDLSLGSLVIGAQTTVAQFSAAVIAENEDWENGDQLTFFYGVQLVDAVTGVPRAKITGFKMLLDTQDATPLWNVVSGLGFTSVAVGGGQVLGMNSVITDGAAAWVHSREDASGNLTVSTQFLYVDSTILARYQDESAFGVSADSYGGINSSAVYLDPKSYASVLAGAAGGGSSQSGGGSDNGSGGNSGGGNPSTGGSGQATVAAPTFSGETQFTETTQVTMSGPAGASIFYTVDGSTPTDQSLEYEEPITLSATTTVKAIAIKDGVSSAVTSRTYSKVEGGDDEPGGDDH